MEGKGRQRGCWQGWPLHQAVSDSNPSWSRKWVMIRRQQRWSETYGIHVVAHLLAIVGHQLPHLVCDPLCSGSHFMSSSHQPALAWKEASLWALSNQFKCTAACGSIWVGTHHNYSIVPSWSAFHLITRGPETRELEKENEGKMEKDKHVVWFVFVFVKEGDVWNSDERYPTLFFYVFSWD